MEQDDQYNTDVDREINGGGSAPHGSVAAASASGVS
jgi:hypothetical protein